MTELLQQTCDIEDDPLSFQNPSLSLQIETNAFGIVENPIDSLSVVLNDAIQGTVV